LTRKKLADYVAECKKYFRPIPPLKISNIQELRNSLDNKIFEFHQGAKSNAVTY
jgi:hypothetical protein